MQDLSAFASIARLSANARQRTSVPVPAELFDMKLRAMRRGRALARGAELFLLERAFADCLERIALIPRQFRSALLIGDWGTNWPDRLGEHAERVAVLDDVEDRWNAPPATFDLCLAIGTLDTVSDLPRALRSIRSALGPDALFIGALSGGDTLPQLRAAMRAADEVQGVAVPHVHPRIEASALAPLLAAAGFTNAVVDVDRARASYESLERLVADLRAMGATNILTQRSRRPLSKAARDAAIRAFAAAGKNGRTTETFEILHFAAWTPSESATGMPDR
jgi:NADH dehydrogenase [ubiquinone] 1 alpha subcomplex assembly factor 5